MKKFLKAYRMYKTKHKFHFIYDRLCWIPIGSNGDGVWSVIEFFDDELDKIDPNKCEIVLF